MMIPAGNTHASLVDKPVAGPEAHSGSAAALRPLSDETIFAR